MIRVASVLLRCFPTSFRSRYGGEVLGLLRDRAAETRRREGIVGVARMWAYQAVDLLRAAYAERRAERERRASLGRRGGASAGGGSSQVPGSRGARPDSRGARPGPRDKRGAPRWDGLGRDLRHALRLLARAPGFTSVAVVTLALGIGATSAIFTVIDGVVLKPLPYPDADELVAVYLRFPGSNFDRVDHTSSTYLTFHDDNRVFEHIGAWMTSEVPVTDVDEPERVEAVLVSEDVFEALDARPLFGRLFIADDTLPGAPATVVLSHGYWSRRFGADPAVIGRTVRVDGEAAEIIGVMGPEFRFLDQDAALYATLRFDRAAKPTVLSFDYRVLARLPEGTTPEAAEDDLQRLLPVSFERYQWATAQQVEEWDLGINVMPLKDAVVGEEVSASLWTLLGSVSLVLLIACANVANLTMVRAEGRRREIAMRTALGASWGRLARQFLVESGVLSLLGAAMGLLVAYAAVPVLIRLAPASVPRAGDIAVNGTVVLFTLVVSIAASVVFGLFPTFHRGSGDLVPALKEGARGASGGRFAHRARSGLAIAEVALALVLLVGAGLMVRSFRALRAVDPGFSDGNQAVTFRLSLPRAEAPDDDQGVAVYEQIIAAISAIPGVAHAGAISGLTMEGHSNQNSFIAEGATLGEADAVVRGAYKAIAGDYFGAAGIPILAGRSISWDDIRSRRPVGVVTDTLARAFWGSADAAIGKRIRHSGNDPWREIIGVVGDIRDGGLRGAPRAVAFWPVVVEDFLGFDSWLRRDMAFVVRTERIDPLDVVGQLREAVWSVNRNLPLADVGRLDRLIERDMAGTTFTLTMLLVAAAVAVLLGTIGIYGVISYVFEQRTHEIGIRVALGATRADVLAMVLRQGAIVGGLGIVVGAAGATGLARLLASQVFGVGTLDVATYGAAALLVGAVAMLASYVPAHRAAHADPLASLRR